jgi:hypothetical protein
VIMGNRRAPKRLGPCMSPPVPVNSGVGKPNRPPTAYEKRVYEVGCNHTAAAWWCPCYASAFVQAAVQSGTFCLLTQQVTTCLPAFAQQMCKAIPKGKVSTYGQMAKALSSSARAVGQVGWLKMGQAGNEQLKTVSCCSCCCAGSAKDAAV